MSSASHTTSIIPKTSAARQLNAKGGTEPLVVNSGANLWLMGMKTEGQQTIISTIGGATELLGALLYPLNNVPPEIPAFVNDGGSVSLSYAISNYHPVAYPTQMLERRAVEWRELLRCDVPGRGYGSNVALYCGYLSPANESWQVNSLK
jgi:hypothetical protein